MTKEEKAAYIVKEVEKLNAEALKAGLRLSLEHGADGNIKTVLTSIKSGKVVFKQT
ncbi:MAG: hypothetical protein LAO23_04560 [Acidobacteriia bacterium]|nr:hypothetical protein [Terriglobia bacterium]